MDPDTGTYPFFNTQYQDHNLSDPEIEQAEKIKRGDGRKIKRDEFIFIG